eukprot:GGOE01004578.1.p1 GENE.GGOE01004578.1~~GGOE01004578.1.p1  ORF type:complete len:246 (-),score=64.78 GGOE01004578.1:189-926(-)
MSKAPSKVPLPHIGLLKPGFPPVLHPSVPPHTLILGTCPSDASLKKAEYFGNSSNTFWDIVGKVLGFDRKALPYDAQEERLGASGYALWDVLAQRQGMGSLDQRTVRGSDAPNDVKGLLAEHPSITRVAINSKTSAAFFLRHHREWLRQAGEWHCGNEAAVEVFGRLVPRGRPGRLAVLVLDSTSPANVPSIRSRQEAGVDPSRKVEGIAEYKLFHTPKGCWGELFYPSPSAFSSSPVQHTEGQT